VLLSTCCALAVLTNKRTISITSRQFSILYFLLAGAEGLAHKPNILYTHFY
jgi:hypothetical protein